MVKIYVIEDINDLKYVGSTKQKYLCSRLACHRWEKTNGRCSSKNLNLDYCIIYQLEECSEDQREEREKYWINKIDCVNIVKFNGRDMEKKKEKDKEYHKKNKERKNQQSREWHQKNKEKRKEYDRLKYQKRKLLKLLDQKNNL